MNPYQNWNVSSIWKHRFCTQYRIQIISRTVLKTYEPYHFSFFIILVQYQYLEQSLI